MSEKEVMDLLLSIDDDLIDEKIDELLKEKGEMFNMDKIKEKALNKLENKEIKKHGRNKKPFMIAAVVAAISITTVYGDEISSVLKSFLNKSTVYSTVVDGEAYYLPKELKLTDEITLLNVSVSKDKLEATIKTYGKRDFDSENMKIIPKGNKEISYTVGGVGEFNKNEMFFSFYNSKEGNYNIAPFKDFQLVIDDKTYDVSLEKGEGVKVDENLKLGLSETIENVANVAGTMTENNIQLITSFTDPELKLIAWAKLNLMSSVICTKVI